MIESYNGPCIDKFLATERGGVLPESAYDTPQLTIADLRQGEWTAAKRGSIFRDYRSGLIFVDSYDSCVNRVNRTDINHTAFIMATYTPENLRRYILDMRRLKNFRLPTANLDIDTELSDDPFDSEMMQRRQARLGTQVIRSFIVRSFDEVHGYVEDDLQLTAAIFAQKVDDFIFENQADLEGNRVVTLPFINELESEVEFHTFDKEMSQMRPHDKTLE